MFVVVRSYLKPSYFYIVYNRSSTGETLKCLDGETWRHYDRATADRVADEANRLGQLPANSPTSERKIVMCLSMRPRTRAR